jgi:hypothetical protein
MITLRSGYIVPALATLAPLILSCKDQGPTVAVLSVEKLVPASSSTTACYQTCEGATPPSPTLKLPDQCKPARSISCGFVGGVDQMRVVLDYGDLTLSSSAGFVAPTAELLGDGALLTTQGMALGPLTAGAERPYATTVLLAPSVRVVSLTVQATLGEEGGGDAFQQGSLNIDLPSGTLTLPGCPAASAVCTRVLQVGQQQVAVTVPSNAASTATVQSLVDDVQQPTTSIPLTAIPGGQISGTQSLDVPTTGKTWTIQGFVGAISLPPQNITLVPPTLTAKLQGCSRAPCGVTAGGAATVTIAAPQLSQVMTATLTSSIAGIDTGQPVTVNLTPCPRETICGVGVVPIPLTAVPGSTWALQATVGLYPTNTLTATVAAPPPDGGT